MICFYWKFKLQKKWNWAEQFNTKNSTKQNIDNVKAIKNTRTLAVDTKEKIVQKKSVGQFSFKLQCFKLSSLCEENV